MTPIRSQPGSRMIAFLVLALGGCAAAAFACDTPVYRYAMYRWEPAPYEVYFFHEQPISEADQRVVRVLQDSASDEKQPANLVYFDVNLVEDKDLTKIPPDVKRAFLAHEDRQLPAYLVFAPFGAELLFGKLDEATARLLVDSPVRTEIAKQLAAGKIGTFIFVPCTDAAANGTAEPILRSLVDDINAGKLELYTPPSGPPPGTAEPGVETPRLEMGLVTVNRDDVREQWLLRSLLATEADLKDENKPMVFLAYGRARVLPAYVGPGISRDNLLYEIEFITGACSCTVKEQNPGVDLLVRQNWEEAAMKLAEKYGAEEGNPYGPGMFYPELVIPSGTAPADATVAAARDENRDDVVATAPPSPAADGNVTAAKTPVPAEPQHDSNASGKSAASAAAGTELVQAAPPTTEIAAVPSPTAQHATSTGAADVSASAGEQAATRAADAVDANQPGPLAPSTITEPASAATPPARSAYSSMLVVGGGLLASLVVLGVVTFLVLRPH